MSKFSLKHYEAVAEVIGWNMMDDDVVEAFSDMFEKDNPRFKPTRFLKAVQRAASGNDIWDDVRRAKKKLEKISKDLSEEERRLLNCDEPHYASMREDWREEIDKATEILGELLDEK